MAAAWDVAHYDAVLFVHGSLYDKYARQHEVSLIDVPYKADRRTSTITVFSFYFYSISITAPPLVEDVINNYSLPPALPPKRSRSIKSRNATPPPVSPKPTVSMQSIYTPETITTTLKPAEVTSAIPIKKEPSPPSPGITMLVRKFYYDLSTTENWREFFTIFR